MSGRTRTWLAVATAFTLINVGGAVYAAVFAELVHFIVHAVGTAFGGVWLWLVAQRARGLSARAVAGDRLDHLEQSVDSIALQVERLGEAQRFSQKLVEEAFSPPVERESKT